MTNLTIEHSPYDPIFQLQNLKYSTATFLICMPQELRSANHDLEIVNSSIYISPYWSPHHPQKSHWQESGLEMEHYLRIYCFHRSSLPLDGVTMNVSWRNRIGTYSHNLCSITSAPTMVGFSRPWSDIRLFLQKSLIFGLILVKITTFWQNGILTRKSWCIWAVFTFKL